MSESSPSVLIFTLHARSVIDVDRGFVVCSPSLPRALLKTEVLTVSGSTPSTWGSPSSSMPPERHQTSLKNDVFGDANQPPLTPASPPPAYGYGGPSAHHQLLQNSPSPPSSYAPRRQRSNSAITAERLEQQSPTSTQLRSKSSSGTLALRSQNTGTTSRLPQQYPPAQRQGPGDPSLSSRTATSSNGSRSTARKKLKCRSGEHDFESKFGVSVSQIHHLFLLSPESLSIYGYSGSRARLLNSVRPL